MIFVKVRDIEFARTDFPQDRTFISCEVDTKVSPELTVEALVNLRGKRMMLVEEFEDLLHGIPTKDLAGEIYRREGPEY